MKNVPLRDQQEPFLLSRRQLLWYSAVLGAGSALPLGWAATMGRTLRLGFVGLGTRGRQALARCRQEPGVEIAALCDRQTDLLRPLLSDGDLAARLVTGEAQQLFADRTIGAVVLAASSGDQIALATAACNAGKDVFLLRPLAVDHEALRRLAEAAAEGRRQVQIARATAFSLDPAAAQNLIAPDGATLRRGEVHALFTAPEQPDAGALLAELIDEVDFAQTLLGGQVVRSLSTGGLGMVPGRWIDQRLHLDLIDGRGDRRGLTVALIAGRAPAAQKSTRVFLRGTRGAAQLSGTPLPAGDPNDLRLFLAAVRSREAGPGFSVDRLQQIMELLSTAAPTII